MSKKEVFVLNGIETEFGAVRTATIDGVPYFVVKDLAAALGYSCTQGLAKRADAKDVVVKICAVNQAANIRVTLINSTGMAALLDNTNRPNAGSLKEQLLAQIAPADFDASDLLNNPDFVIKAMEKLKAANETAAALAAKVKAQDAALADAEKTNKELQSKADYCDKVLNCKNAIPITVIAKEYGWSGQRLNAYLFFKGVQYNCHGVWVLYQKYAAEGYTATKTKVKNEKMAQAITFSLWTQKGKQFIYNLLKADGYLQIKEQTESRVAKPVPAVPFQVVNSEKQIA